SKNAPTEVGNEQPPNSISNINGSPPVLARIQIALVTPSPPAPQGNSPAVAGEVTNARTTNESKSPADTRPASGSSQPQAVRASQSSSGGDVAYDYTAGAT